MSVGVFVTGVQNSEARDALEGGEIPWADRRNAERELRVLRERLVVNYSPLVKYVACRVSACAICPVELEDVLSWGIFGLLEAVETYDPARRTKFESYAISKIRWAILDELRRLDPLSRSVRRVTAPSFARSGRRDRAPHNP